jgi:sugar phosphate permease
MSAEAPNPALRYRWVVFWILALGYVLVYFHRLCPAVLALDMMEDLSATGSLLGFLGSAYFYPYALMQLPAGLLSDSWGPRKTITVFFFVAFVGSVVLGMAPTVLWAIVGRALVGIGVSFLFVPTMKALAEWFRPREFATMAGILMLMGGVGSLSAAAPLALLNAWIGWRYSFTVIGCFTVVLGALVWIFVRDRPSDKGWPPVTTHAGSAAEPIGLWQGVIKVLSHPPFWPLAIWFFFDCAIFFAFGGLWGGPFLTQIYGLSKAEAGNVLSMLAVGMVIGSPLLSLVSNRVFKGRKPVLVGSSIIALGMVTFLAFLTDRFSVMGLYLFCLGLGLFTSAIVVVGFTSAKELFPVQMAGTSTGLVNLFPFAGGAVFQPLLGYILERSGQVDGAFTIEGYHNAFMVLFACGVIALVSSLFMRETMVKE